MKQCVLLITLVICLSVAVGALPQEVQPDGNRQIEMIGKDRLVSAEPLPAMVRQAVPSPEGELETLMAAASAPESLMALVEGAQAGAATGPPPRPSEAERAAVANRPPIRTIHDARHVFAAIDVDPIRNELVAGDENNFSIVVYDRMTNTPPTAAFSEPRRVIQGENTFLEYVCGIYIDPESGDIYAINNDTLNWMTVWGRDAQGNVAPKRKLATPHTTVRMSVDEATQEIFMTVQDDHAVSVFRKSAEDEEEPLRLIQGSATRLADPHGIAVDSSAGLIYVTNWGTVADRHYDTDGPTTLNRGDGKANWPVGREANIPGSGKERAALHYRVPKECPG